MIGADGSWDNYYAQTQEVTDANFENNLEVIPWQCDAAAGRLNTFNTVEWWGITLGAEGAVVASSGNEECPRCHENMQRGRGFNVQAGSYVPLPVHQWESCAPHYPEDSTLHYVDLTVVVDTSQAEDDVGSALGTYVVEGRALPEGANIITSYSGASYHEPGELLLETTTPGVYAATISVIAGKEIILLVKEEFEGYYLDSAEDFTGQQCPASFGTTGEGYASPTRMVTPTDDDEQTVHICWLDCHANALCECGFGQYREAGADAIESGSGSGDADGGEHGDYRRKERKRQRRQMGESFMSDDASYDSSGSAVETDATSCVACPVPDGCYETWPVAFGAPYASCTDGTDSVCGIRAGDACGNGARTVQVNYAVFGDDTSGLDDPRAALPPVDGGWLTDEWCGGDETCAVDGSPVMCRCIAEFQVAAYDAALNELAPGAVHVVLANYGEWLDRPTLYSMAAVNHMEFVKLEMDKNAMIRPSMVNIGVAYSVGPDTAGYTWLGSQLTKLSSPLALIRSDFMPGGTVATHEFAHMVGMDHVAGEGEGVVVSYDQCALGLEVPNLEEPSCHVSPLGSWTSDDLVCTDEETYYGLNTKEHGASFSLVTACWLHMSNEASPDCNFIGSDCQRGQCLGENVCVCEPGWYQTKGGCNLCAPGYSFDYDKWDCIEEGSDCDDHLCSESLCAPGCNDDYLGDGICHYMYCDTAECGYDAGDCLGEAEIQGWAIAGLCHNSWVGDGVCDVNCNVAEGEFDGGDCDAAATQDPPICVESGRRRKLTDGRASKGSRGHPSTPKLMTGADAVAAVAQPAPRAADKPSRARQQQQQQRGPSQLNDERAMARLEHRRKLDDTIAVDVRIDVAVATDGPTAREIYDALQENNACLPSDIEAAELIVTTLLPPSAPPASPLPSPPPSPPPPPPKPPPGPPPPSKPEPPPPPPPKPPPPSPSPISAAQESPPPPTPSPPPPAPSPPPLDDGVEAIVTVSWGFILTEDGATDVDDAAVNAALSQQLVPWCASLTAESCSSAAREVRVATEAGADGTVEYFVEIEYAAERASAAALTVTRLGRMSSARKLASRLGIGSNHVVHIDSASSEQGTTDSTSAGSGRRLTAVTAVTAAAREGRMLSEYGLEWFAAPLEAATRHVAVEVSISRCCGGAGPLDGIVHVCLVRDTADTALNEAMRCTMAEIDELDCEDQPNNFCDVVAGTARLELTSTDDAGAAVQLAATPANMNGWQLDSLVVYDCETSAACCDALHTDTSSDASFVSGQASALSEDDGDDSSTVPWWSLFLMSLLALALAAFIVYRETGYRRLANNETLVKGTSAAADGTPKKGRVGLRKMDPEAGGL